MLLLAGCGGSSGGSGGSDDVDDPDAPIDTGGEPSSSDVTVIEGDIARYGVVNVADEDGTASDAIAAFYRVEPSVAPAAFGSVLDAERPTCRVAAASTGGNDILSVVFLPNADGADNRSIDAGETVGLASDAGTWAELTGGAAGAFNFYAPMALPAGAVPSPLTASVSAASDADGFPAFDAVELPAVVPLADFAHGDDDSVRADTEFTWQANEDPTSRVRLVSQTAGAFFSGEGVRVACLVPDTGSFRFPAEVRAQLGADFDGEPPMVSRIAVATVQQGDSLLFLLRESFVD